jgi:transposase
MGSITFVGMDVHKATVDVTVAEGVRGGEVRQLGIFANRAEVIAKLAKRLAGDGRELSFCYEAGPCGYGLQRQLEGLGHACVVVAPSLIPSKPGVTLPRLGGHGLRPTRPRRVVPCGPG